MDAWNLSWRCALSGVPAREEEEREEEEERTAEGTRTDGADREEEEEEADADSGGSEGWTSCCRVRFSADSARHGSCQGAQHTGESEETVS